MTNLNIVVAGKAGAGKSSLLNYLVGNEIFETGVGLPVTKDYFDVHPYKDPLTGIQYNLFDTKGVEPDTTLEFEKAFEDKIEEYKQQNDIFKQIHTIYYCISAASKRVEPFEIEFLKKMNEIIHIVIVLTKCDLANQNDITELKNELNNQLNSDENEDAIKIIQVCSIKKETRKGVSEVYGKKEILDESFRGLWETFVKDYPSKIVSIVQDYKFEIDISNSIYLFWSNYYLVQYGESAREYYSTLSYLKLLDLPPSDFLQIEEINAEVRNLFFNVATTGKELLTNKKLTNIVKDYKHNLKQTAEDILQFYEQLTGERYQIYLAMSFAKISEIEKLLLEDGPTTLIPIVDNLKSKAKNFPIEKWLTYNLTKELIGTYDHLCNVSYELFHILDSKISSFEDICSAELNQFGRQNLKVEEVVLEDKVVFSAIDKFADLNSNERKYYQALDDNFSCSNKEERRAELNFLCKYLPINHTRAGQIEDFYRDNQIAIEKVVESPEEIVINKYTTTYKTFLQNDGIIDETERFLLEELRKKLLLTKESTSDLELELKEKI